MLDQNGAWALVTGASSGIGREFVHHLANTRMNVVLVARRKDSLDELAQEIKVIHGLDSLVIAQDLSQTDAAISIRYYVEQAGVRIRLLVNNAGTGRWGRFEEGTIAEYQQMLAVNNGAMVALCREFFPHLCSFERSAVINVSSQAAFQPVPFMAVYAASKAFLQSFSIALYEEWKKYGIHVQTLIPGPTATEFDTKAGAYKSGINERRPPVDAVTVALRYLERDEPVVASVKGIYKQRFLGGVLPYKFLVREVAKLFRPPDHK